MGNRHDNQGWRDQDRRHIRPDHDDDTAWRPEDVEPRGFSGEQTYGRPGRFGASAAAPLRGTGHSEDDHGRRNYGQRDYGGSSGERYSTGGYPRPGGGYGPQGYGAESRGEGHATYDQRDFSPAARRDQWREDQRFGDHHSTGETWNRDNIGRDERYGASYRSTEDHHEPHYRRWRDEQLANHDRDYAEWRNQQVQRYDSEYGHWKNQRHQSFAREFEGWRNTLNESPTGPEGGGTHLTGASTGARGAETGHNSLVTGVSNSGGGATGSAQISGGSSGVPDASQMGAAVQPFLNAGSGGRSNAGAATRPASASTAISTPAATDSVQDVTDGGSGSAEHHRHEDERTKR